MKDKNLKEIFLKNLKNLMEEKKVSQTQLAKDLKLSKATISEWLSGKFFPRHDKIDLLAKYFNVSPDYFMSEKFNEEQHYYTNEETKALAEELRTNKELKVLFDAAKDASPEDLQTTYDMLLALKRKEQREDE